ncbi:MAG TPA: glycosyltransferase family 4 protein [Vicinamibacterales bacterium]|nr:glycosyltransferase family 4 protein [Vicinamibacterales bacterium]
MKILYAAIDQVVPGTNGGSVHVAAVAEGLAALGHEMIALVTPGDTPVSGSRVRWVPLPPPLGSTHLRLARARRVARIARAERPDVIIERYHNFGGEAIRLSRGLGAVGVLEVNAPVIDFPGSRKALIDRALVAQPMRRWREHLVSIADLVVTPDAGILPRGTPRDKIAVLEWGADTDVFKPHAGEAVAARGPARTLAVFAGAFRNWHGAIHLVRAIRSLERSGRGDIGALMIGHGPEWDAARAEAGGSPLVQFTNAVPHSRMPGALAQSDIGVAPFDVAAHGPLALGFFWSPLKIFEYMAAGLPVVAPSIDRIRSLVGHEREGILYDPSASDALAQALVRLADDPALRTRLGVAARERAVREYSWAAHCRALEKAITQKSRDLSLCP